ncbi:transposase, partial [uncultured Bradyrhizobium sp.]|uniref:transposase n=1 Tax=uncultured Bradyrhizobium sp. TaxID=199684 RepID=UPI0035CBC3B5
HRRLLQSNPSSFRHRIYRPDRNGAKSSLTLSIFSGEDHPSSRSASPIVARPREGHRRRFSEADKRQILDQAALDGTSAAEVARRYGIDARVLRRWKQELAPPAFVAVEITDAETVA